MRSKPSKGISVFLGVVAGGRSEGQISTCQYLSILKSLNFGRVSPNRALAVLRRSRPWLENTAPAEKCRYLLHMAARAWPGAADGSKWPLEPAPGPQMARNGRSSLPRSRRILDGCRSSLPWSRRMLDGRLSSLPGTAECSTGAARACPGVAECSTGAARACPGGAERSTGAARACPGAAACSKSAARAHSREVRSFLALEMAARKMLPHVPLLSASSFARRHLASCMLCTGSH